MASWTGNDKNPQQESADERNGELSLNMLSNGQSCAVIRQYSSAEHMSAKQTPQTETEGRSQRHKQKFWKQLQVEKKPKTIETEKLKFPKYRTFAARASSFTNWPVQIKQTPDQMADAGLFFTGFDDCVRCFVCGGKLRQWCIDDDPWTEHCRLFPLCSFARTQKGDPYIAKTQVGVNSDNEGDEYFGYEQSHLIEQLEVRTDLEDKRGVLLEMGYEDCDVKKVVRHFRNMGAIQPTLEELVEALVALKERTYRYES